MKKAIVIITYSLDWWQLELLSRTIVKFACQSEHIKIIVNEPRKYAEELIENFKRNKKNQKFLCRHHVEFMACEDIIKDPPWRMKHYGWIFQQILKILISNYIDTNEYILLDSKNFFINDFLSDNILNSEPNKLKGYSNERIQATKFYCDLFNVDFDSSFMHNITPFVMNTQCARALVQHFEGSEKFTDWFVEHSKNIDQISPMEFHLYDVFSRHWGLPLQDYSFCNYATLWEHSFNENWKVPCREILARKKEGCVVSGLHKSFIKQCPFNKAFYILKYIGLGDNLLTFRKSYNKTRKKLIKNG